MHRQRLGLLAPLSAAACAAAAGLILASSASAGVTGFEYGVAAGEVTSNSTVLWAKAKSSGEVTAQVAVDKKFKNVVATAKTKAKSGADNTVQVEIASLKADQAHLFRFCAKKACSDTGTFTTAPQPSKAKKIEFAYTGGTDGTPAAGSNTPFFGDFAAFKSMQAEGNLFNFHLGDTIYSDSEVEGAAPALTVEQKWAKYRQNLGQKNYSNLRGSAAYYSSWDDQEFTNDFSVTEDGVEVYEAGVKAFTDYAPVSYSKADGLYRTFRWGKNLEVFVLDERSFRSAGASQQCLNPQTGEPDLAPTAPTSKRTLFANLAPSLSAAVAAGCRNQINSGERTMLGREQLTRFLRDVSKSDATWKLVLNETPIQQLYALPYDRWEGYAFERVKLLKELQNRGVQNLAFLSTDIDAPFANAIRLRTFTNDTAPVNAPPTADVTPFSDFAVGPVATGTYWEGVDSITGVAGAGKTISEAFFKPAPPDGVGMSCAQGDVFGYGQVTVTQGALKVEYKDERGEPVIDVNGEPCGAYSIATQ